MRLLTLSLFLGLPCIAATIRVPADQPTIQAGIDAAIAGDTVLVDCGTYYEFDIQLKDGITLSSATGSSDCVTIDVQDQGRAITCENVGESTSIVGLTITGCLIGPGNPYGGAILVTDGSPTVANCSLIGNQGSNGGGMCCYNSNPTISNCRFVGNSAENGGGLYCYDNSSPLVTGCLFESNFAAWGAGLLCHSSSSPTLTFCTFASNSAEGYWGGGIACYYSNPTLQNCTFWDNSASNGGGVHSMYSKPVISYSIISFSSMGDAVFCLDEESIPILTCTDLYGNTGGGWIDCIADQFGTNGNTSVDPYFCNPYLGDFTIRDDSPCAPNNNGCGVLMGAFPVGCSTAVESRTWSQLKVLY